MAEIIRGDYKYTYVEGSGTASVKVVDITKDEYGTIESSLTIDGQTYIVTDASGCFYACSNLIASPIIPNTVTNMSGCFYGCSSLENVSISNAVTDLSTCFYNCISLEIFPTISSNSVVDMTACFYGCENITGTPTIPDGVLSINSCFYRCHSLTTPPSIPNSVTDMAYCFGSCTGLTSAPTITESITDLTFCFYNCTALTRAPEISDNVTNLCGCFYGCSALTVAPQIPSSVVNMKQCFAGCTALTGNIVVLNNPTVYDFIFNGISSLGVITVEPNSAVHAVYNKWNTIVNEYNGVEMETEFDGSIDSIDISDYRYIIKPETQNQFWVSVKQNNKNKTSYDSIISSLIITNIPYYVTTMDSCFQGCTSLVQTPIIPNSITSMANCFKGCTSLTQAPSIPSSVTNMAYCFEQCSALTGNILVANTFDNSEEQYILDGTSQPIYIVNTNIASPADQASVASTWRAIASEYSNVHYEVDDATFQLSCSVRRVNNIGDIDENNGQYVYIEVITEFTGMPIDWTAQANKILKENNQVIEVQKDKSTKGWIEGTSISKAWFHVDDLQEHTYQLTATPIFVPNIYGRDPVQETEEEISITTVLAKLVVAFSLYHSPETQTDGAAFGQVANKAEFLDIDWDTQFQNNIYLDLDLDTTTLDSKSDVIGDLLFELDVDAGASASQDATSGANVELFNAIRKLGWFSSVITE